MSKQDKQDTHDTHDTCEETRVQYWVQHNGEKLREARDRLYDTLASKSREMPREVKVVIADTITTLNFAIWMLDA